MVFTIFDEDYGKKLRNSEDAIKLSVYTHNDGTHIIAFMYSLYESCKLNDLNFFDYINDVLTRLMKGEMDYKSLIPCNYKPLPNDNGEGQ